MLTVAILGAYTIGSIEFRMKLPMAEMNREGAAQFTERRVRSGLEAEIVRWGHTVSGDGRTVNLSVTRLDQRNRDRRAIIDDPNGGGSITEVTVVIDLAGVKQTRKGQAKGPYFGTSNRRDFTGAPDAVTRAIEVQNGQRADAIARAVAAALRQAL